MDQEEPGSVLRAANGVMCVQPSLPRVGMGSGGGSWGGQLSGQWHHLCERKGRLECIWWWET